MNGLAALLFVLEKDYPDHTVMTAKDLKDAIATAIKLEAVVILKSGYNEELEVMFKKMKNSGDGDDDLPKDLSFTEEF